MAAGDHQQAAAEFKEALALNPGYVAAQVNLGHACGRVGSHDTARVPYEIDPGNPDARESISAA